MHDTRANRGADVQVRESPKQSMHEGSCLVAGGGMDDETSRFVDYDDIGIFVNDTKGNLLGYQFRRQRWRHYNTDDITRLRFDGGLGGPTVDSNVTGLDQLLDE
jgi:hypothetical protein